MFISGLLLLPFMVISLSFLVSNELSCDHVDILMSLYFVAFLHGINFLQVYGDLVGILSAMCYLRNNASYTINTDTSDTLF